MLCNCTDEVPSEGDETKQTLIEPLTEPQLSQLLDELMSSQSNSGDSGVQVAAQWVLSLNNNGPYLVRAPQTVEPGKQPIQVCVR